MKIKDKSIKNDILLLSLWKDKRTKLLLKIIIQENFPKIRKDLYLPTHWKCKLTPSFSLFFY